MCFPQVERNEAEEDQPFSKLTEGVLDLGVDGC